MGSSPKLKAEFLLYEILPRSTENLGFIIDYVLKQSVPHPLYFTATFTVEVFKIINNIQQQIIGVCKMQITTILCNKNEMTIN